MPGRYHVIEDLPRTIGIFPLSGVLLLPRGQLPLNVFEPRYLSLVDAAMSGDRIIGMIQPQDPEDQTLKPRLSSVGCVGRVTAYRETEDNRYLITLSGICRFRVETEVAVATPFRQVAADYAPFAGDLAEGDDETFPREQMLEALNAYLKRRELKADWRSVMNAPAETLVNALAMLCPFEPSEKQALLEAPSWGERVSTLLALLEMSGAANGPHSMN
ncbi:MAG: LON peptidase substrate-binding domain-containing protein [Proteobacteria bacterium]|nr:LON peptidase substrate-binding domain-containing protein [Pseudomonadota bacterium]